MALALSPGNDPSEIILASGLPLAPSLKFWSLSNVGAEAKAQLDDVTRKSPGGRSVKAKVTSVGADQERKIFLSGLLDNGGAKCDSNDGDDNVDDGDSDSS